MKRLRRKENKGSMTVEAALVLPIFLVIFINLISMVDMLGLYSCCCASLQQTGSQMAIYMNGYDLLKDGSDTLPQEDNEGETDYSEIENLLFREGAARLLFYENYSNKDYYSDLLTDTKVGFTFFRSSVMEDDDLIDLIVTYRAQPYLNMFHLGSEVFITRCYVRAWTGYDVTQEETEETEWVYITESGEVYHKTAYCTHLSLSVRKVTRLQLVSLRNGEGRKYSPCSICKSEKEGAGIYITDEGTCYHTKRDCPGIKRTVFCVKLTDLNGYRPCERCKP